MENVNELYKLHNEIAEKSKEIKSIKKNYEELSAIVQEQMEQEGLSQIKLGNGKILHLKEKKSLGSLNKDYILETLRTIFKKPSSQHNRPDELAEKTTDTIIEGREVKLSKVLKFLNK